MNQTNQNQAGLFPRGGAADRFNGGQANLQSSTVAGKASIPAGQDLNPM